MAVQTTPTPAEAVEYVEKLAQVVGDFEALGHGARLNASIALGVASSRVSGVLLYRGIDRDLLDNLGQWATNERRRRGV